MHKMTIKQVLDNLDYSKKESINNDIFYEVCNDLPWHIDLEDYNVFMHPIANWLCTDTHVGYYVITHNNDPIAITCQSGRKNCVNIFWISQKKADEFIKFLNSLNNQKPGINLIGSLEQFIDDGRGIFVEFSGQLLTKELIFVETGEIVKVDKTFSDYNQIDDWRFVVVEFKDGIKKKLKMSEVLVPYNLKKENKK